MKFHAYILIRPDGTTEPLDRPMNANQIADKLEADSLDTVDLRDGRTMWVDDLGHSKDLPVNPEATRLYLSICHPGTMHQIVGPVILTDDGGPL